jgi:hypothetical protein
MIVKEALPAQLAAQLNQIALQLAALPGVTSNLQWAENKIKARLASSEPLHGADWHRGDPLQVMHSAPATTDNYALYLGAICLIDREQDLAIILQYRLID